MYKKLTLVKVCLSKTNNNLRVPWFKPELLGKRIANISTFSLLTEMSIVGGPSILTTKDILRSYLRDGPPSDEEISKLDGFIDAVRDSAEKVGPVLYRISLMFLVIFIS